MKSERQTAIVITIAHDEVTPLCNALKSALSVAAKVDLTADDIDQSGAIRNLIALLEIRTTL